METWGESLFWSLHHFVFGLFHSFISCCYENIPWQKQHNWGRIYVSSQFQASVCHSRRVPAAGAWENSHYIYSQEQRAMHQYMMLVLSELIHHVHHHFILPFSFSAGSRHENSAAHTQSGPYHLNQEIPYKQAHSPVSSRQSLAEIPSPSDSILCQVDNQN